MSTSAQALYSSLSTAIDICTLIGRSEDLHLETKTCAEPFSEDDQKRLAKALSSFANSDSGVLIYGLASVPDAEAGRDVITREAALTDAEATRSRISGLISQVVEPPVENVLTKTILLSDDLRRGFVVVLIPRCDGILRRSKKNREFYRRHGSSSLPMENYEIAEYYGRRTSPKLELWWEIKIVSTSGDAPNRNRNIAVFFGIKNVGRRIAKYPAILLKTLKIGFSSARDGYQRTITGIPTENGQLFSGGADHVIYPDSNLEFCKSGFAVNEQDRSGPHLKFGVELYAEDAETIRGEFDLPFEKVFERTWRRNNEE